MPTERDYKNPIRHTSGNWLDFSDTLSGYQLLLLLLLLIYLPGPESGIRGLQNRLVEDIYKQTLNKEIHQLVDINHSHYLYLQRKEIK